MNRKYTPIRTSNRFEYHVASICDAIFYMLVLFIIYKLLTIYGGF